MPKIKQARHPCFMFPFVGNVSHGDTVSYLFNQYIHSVCSALLYVALSHSASRVHGREGREILPIQEIQRKTLQQPIPLSWHSQSGDGEVLERSFKIQAIANASGG